jgi:hypothetical protein
MSHSPKYVPVEHFQAPMPAIQAGKSGVPEVITAGGVISSASSVLLSTNWAAGDSITFGAVALTAVAANPTAVQFVPGASLAASLTSLVAQFNGLLASQAAYPGVAAGLFSTNGTTTLTCTPSYGATTGFTVASAKTSGGTNTITQSTNLGSALSYISMDTEHTQFNAAGAFDVYLPDGDESQKKSLAMFGAGTVTMRGLHMPGVLTTITFNGNDAVVLQFLGAKWRLVMNDGAVAA